MLTHVRRRDLADIRESGALNKDEFAVALKLIRDNLAGKELPNVLPVGLTPPSLRQAAAAREPLMPVYCGSQEADVYSPIATPQPQRNLLDFDDDEPATATILPQATGQYASSLTPQGTGQYPPSSTFPQSTGMAPQSTGTSYPGLQGTIFPQATGASQQTLSPQGTGFRSNVQGTFFFSSTRLESSLTR